MRTRIVSANLRVGLVDPDWLLELVRSMHADVVALQEAGPRHFEALARELPHGGYSDDPEAGLEGSAAAVSRRHNAVGLALRHPAKNVSVPMAWRPARHAALDPSHWPGLTRPLDVWSVHIAAPHLYTPPLYPFWMRRQQVRALEKRFLAPAGEPEPRGTVVVGDFNATPLWPVYRRLASHFTDAAVAVAQRRGRDAQPTWGPWPGARRLLRIDHALVHGVKVLDFHVVALAGSDHSAVVMDVAG